MNVIALQAVLSADPELRHTQDGLPRLSVPISFHSDRPDEPDYQIRVIAFGQLAEEIHQSFHHGDGVFVEGRLQAETRTKPDGSKEKVTEVIARRFHPIAPAATLPSQFPTTLAAPTPTPAAPTTAPAPATTTPAKPAVRTPAKPGNKPATTGSGTDIELPF